MTKTTHAEWMSPDQFAKWLDVPVRTVYAWMHEGTAPRSYKVGRHRRFRRSDVERWLSDRVDTPQPAA